LGDRAPLVEKGGAHQFFEKGGLPALKKKKKGGKSAAYLKKKGRAPLERGGKNTGGGLGEAEVYVNGAGPGKTRTDGGSGGRRTGGVHPVEEEKIQEGGFYGS